MSTNATPGQIAYEAYLRAWSITGLRTWDDEPRGQQRAWEGAAQAVLDAWQTPPRGAHEETRVSARPVVPNPIMLYVRMSEASAALARQIQILDSHEPTLAMPVEAAWLVLDDLLEQLPAALAHDGRRARTEDEPP